MWNPLAVMGLALLAQAGPAPAVSPPATPGPVLRVCRQAEYAELEKLKLAFPEQYTLVSFNTSVRDAPSSEGKVLERLPVGTKLEAVGLVEGTEARNDCEASPYDGCVDATNAWLEVKLPGTNPRQGFLSFINVRAPATLACDTLPFTQLLQLHTPPSWKKVEEPAPARSFFDSAGPENFLVLHVVDGRVGLTRRQLEFFVRNQPAPRPRYGTVEKETGYAYFKPLLTDIELQPALPVFILKDGRLSAVKLDKLQAVEPVFTGEEDAVDGDMYGRDRPLYSLGVSFRLPKALAKAEVLLLTTPTGARALQGLQPAVTRENKKERNGTQRTTRSWVHVDLDSDGVVDLVRERVQESDTDSEYDRTSVRVAIGGQWYLNSDN